ncbi:MAG: hypothetical protein PWP47_1054 [Synergistaceae bacterium]|nr:hypothetical protein [Synergistaceae bacterium]
MKEGFVARALAMPTRCRCPPENWWGYLSACSGLKPTMSRRRSIRLSASSFPETVRWKSMGSMMMSFILCLGFSEA